VVDVDPQEQDLGARQGIDIEVGAAEVDVDADAPVRVHHAQADTLVRDLETRRFDDILKELGKNFNGVSLLRFSFEDNGHFYL